MPKILLLTLGLPLCAFLTFAAEDVATAVSGTVKKIDSGTKTVVVKTADGTEETYHYAKKTTVHGAEDTAAGTKDALHGLKEGKTIDRGAKTLTVKTADGAEETYHIADHAVRDTAKGIGEGTEKTAKVTVYYTEEGGKKVAHFFKKAAD
jgi:hypothetical protein